MKCLSAKLIKEKKIKQIYTSNTSNFKKKTYLKGRLVFSSEWVILLRPPFYSSKLPLVNFPFWKHRKLNVNYKIIITLWNIYRHTSFYYTSLYCVVYKLKACGNPALSKSTAHFSTSICSFRVSASHFGNSCNISNFLLLYLLWWSVISDPWCYHCKKVTTHWRLRWWLAFFSNKIFLIKVCTLFF